MALSDADLDAAWTKARSKNGPQWVPYFEALRAVEALVRKDDEALIRQLVEAQEVTASDVCQVAHHKKRDQHGNGDARPVQARHDAAITAGRARLGRPHD